MNKFFLLVVVEIAGFLSGAELLAQQDSVERIDTTVQLLEQVEPVDDSPILDFLSWDSLMTDVRLSSRTRIRSALQQSEGYRTAAYRGSQLYSYQRLKWNAGAHLSGGVLMEKDAGERSVADFTSFNLTLSDAGPFSKWIVGDYLIEAGQGVAFWRGYDFTKGANVVAPARREAEGLRSYLSSDESAFLRGTAVELNSNPLVLTLFYSHRFYSATMDSSLPVHGFYTEGYYRTESEIAKIGNVSEAMVGARGVAQITLRNAVGATIYYNQYSHAVVLDGGRKFSGTDLGLVSLDYHLAIGQWETFGEWAVARNVWGGNSGIHFRPASSIGFVASYRSYPAQFYSPHGLAFADRSGASNERGLYLGVHFSPRRSMHVSLFYDQFQFPEPAGSIRFPSGGHDAFAEFNTTQVRRLGLTFRIQRKEYEVQSTVPAGNGLPSSIIEIERKNSYRLTLDYNVSRYVSLRERIDRLDLRSSILHASEKGLLSSHDITYDDDGRMQVSFRLLLFETDSYDSRVYEYERDLDGAASFPALYGHGVRWYALIRYAFGDRLVVGAKYSDLTRDDVKRIGSGLDELPGNRDNRISFQIDLHY